MKRYTNLYSEVMKVLDESKDRGLVTMIVDYYQDPNNFEIFRSAIFSIFYEKITQSLALLDQTPG